ncbi:oxidoreductase [Paenibacillus sedimenti]|uniref:Oxidoreductase n=1 Tax=Paenibacillus sedimenti TaxID=2770274 RepID=A0A926KPX9_9BACL|nr:oxidoreductase [Paenibacillus sedimenti]MBD0380183.1 oxidoreductase [Paenibacillus sedimenti]
MKHLNYLQTRPSSRYDDNDPEQEGNKNTKFADLIIDDRSLYQMLKKYDMVPSLGWGSEEHQKQMIDYFLLNQMHTYLFYRYPILVCPWCGDEDCGFISVFIEREEDLVIWRDFKLEPDNKSINIGPFYFKWEDYKSAINNTYGTAGIQ